MAIWPRLADVCNNKLLVATYGGNRCNLSTSLCQNMEKWQNVAKKNL